MRCSVCKQDFEDEKVIRNACVDCRWAINYLNKNWPHPYPLDSKRIGEVKGIRTMLQNKAEAYVSMRIAAVFTLELFKVIEAVETKCVVN